MRLKEWRELNPAPPVWFKDCRVLGVRMLKDSERYGWILLQIPGEGTYEELVSVEIEVETESEHLSSVDAGKEKSTRRW